MGTLSAEICAPTKLASPSTRAKTAITIRNISEKAALFA